jgi:hypothetical protein
VLPTKAVFQVFRAATATTAVAFSTVLAATATGGALPSRRQRLPGAVSCTMAVALQTGTSTLREMVFPSVASGIELNNLFDYLII